MPSRKRQRLTLGVFEAVRRDTSLTPEGQVAVAVRPEWVWAAQVLTRLNQEGARHGSEFAKRYVRAVGAVQTPTGARVQDLTADAWIALASAVSGRESRAADNRIAEAAARLTDEAEAAGSSRLAGIIAASALRACKRASATAQGKLLTKVARGYRVIGDLEKADALYARVAATGRRARNYDLLTRGTLGVAVVARERGNYHEAIRQFELALGYAERSRSRELQIYAHQGMHVVAELTGDLAKWLRHAWLSYTLSIGDTAHEIETLHNVAWAACVAGLVTEALAVQRAILERGGLSPRMRFHYLRAMARSAALAGQRDLLDTVPPQLEALGTRTPYVYEFSLSLVNLGEAYSLVGERSRARIYRERGFALARQYGLTEVLHRATYVHAFLAKAVTAEMELTPELAEMRRTFQTIAAGVLGTVGPAQREPSGAGLQGRGA